jgi:hypothetical protein
MWLKNIRGDGCGAYTRSMNATERDGRYRLLNVRHEDTCRFTRRCCVPRYRASDERSLCAPTGQVLGK